MAGVSSAGSVMPRRVARTLGQNKNSVAPARHPPRRVDAHGATSHFDDQERDLSPVRRRAALVRGAVGHHDVALERAGQSVGAFAMSENKGVGVGYSKREGRLSPPGLEFQRLGYFLDCFDDLGLGFFRSTVEIRSRPNHGVFDCEVYEVLPGH